MRKLPTIREKCRDNCSKLSDHKGTMLIDEFCDKFVKIVNLCNNNRSVLVHKPIENIVVIGHPNLILIIMGIIIICSLKLTNLAE